MNERLAAANEAAQRAVNQMRAARREQLVGSGSASDSEFDFEFEYELESQRQRLDLNDTEGLEVVDVDLAGSRGAVTRGTAGAARWAQRSGQSAMRGLPQAGLEPQVREVPPRRRGGKAGGGAVGGGAAGQRRSMQAAAVLTASLSAAAAASRSSSGTAGGGSASLAVVKDHSGNWLLRGFNYAGVARCWPCGRRPVCGSHCLPHGALSVVS